MAKIPCSRCVRAAGELGERVGCERGGIRGREKGMRTRGRRGIRTREKGIEGAAVVWAGKAGPLG